MAPIIGITGSGVSELPAKTKLHEAFYSVPTPYVESVARAGGIPVILPPMAANPLTLLESLDGIIFSGGADLHPRHYSGDAAHPEVQTPDEARDDFELALMAAVLRAPAMPFLGICRGAQVLNVAMGGSLHEHLRDHLDEDMHRPDGGGWTSHDVRIAPQSHLARHMGALDVHTVSGHHQALAKVADGLDVVARSADGVVEAVEIASHPWRLAVQWHPERSSAEDPTQQRLFDTLVEFARLNRK